MEKKISLYKLFPTFITMIAFCTGLTSIKYAIDGNFEMSVIMVLIACFMDGVDGSAARLLKSTSTFGAQMDSMSDLVSFGVAPAVILYYWGLKQLGPVGWIISLIYASCTALRLARYNAEDIAAANSPKQKKKYFSGISSPCGAGLALTPMMLSFQIFEFDTRRSLVLSAFFVLFIALMMVSTIPTFSTKSLKVERRNIPFIMGGMVAIAAAMFAMPWITIPIMSFFYILSIPLSWFHYTQRSLTTLWQH